MPAEANWEPLTNVIASAETAGYTVSKSQLWRLTSAGIVGEPKVESRGRSLGKESHYPVGCVNAIPLHIRDFFDGVIEFAHPTPAPSS